MLYTMHSLRVLALHLVNYLGRRCIHALAIVLLTGVTSVPGMAATANGNPPPCNTPCCILLNLVDEVTHIGKKVPYYRCQRFTMTCYVTCGGKCPILQGPIGLCDPDADAFTCSSYQCQQQLVCRFETGMNVDPTCSETISSCDQYVVAVGCIDAAETACATVGLGKCGEVVTVFCMPN